MKCPQCNKIIKKGHDIICITLGTVLSIKPARGLHGEEIDFTPMDKEYFYHYNCFWLSPKK